ncbi:fibronectin type III domain-containing protein, partial [Kroppenstedtia guangzhouensis]|uniref:fibronectin type III domain-containing protein n=1 Tax=Kroppenstedtia guangzhouensis TaxID=1274356 RepID=UPI001E331051
LTKFGLTSDGATKINVMRRSYENKRRSRWPDRALGVAVSEENSVRLSWNDVGDNYKIYLINDEKGDKFVWSDSKKTFTVQNLKSDQPYIYRVEAYVGKKRSMK